MNALFHSISVTCLMTASVLAAPLELGVSEAEAYRVMGTPTGTLELPQKHILLYDTAELTFVDGVLTEATWRSPEAAEAEKAMQAKLRADWEAEQALLAQQRKEQGERILKARRANPEFQNLPARERLRAWADFIRDYPMIDASVEYEQSLKEVRSLAKAAEAEQLRVAQAQQPSDAGWSQTSLIDSYEIGGGYRGWDYTGPSVAIGNDSVVVVGGNSGYYGYCPPVQSNPILNVSYRTDNFGIRFSSGGNYFRRDPYVIPRQPIIIINRPD